MIKFLQTYVLLPILRKKNAMANQAQIKRGLADGSITLNPASITALDAAGDRAAITKK